MSELAKWDKFVVLTLIAARPQTGSADAGAAFGSPTVVHFGVVLFVSALLNIPWQTINIIATLWGLMGFGGIVYSVIIVRRMRKQAAYKPVFEDWLCHVALPIAAYVILALSSFAAPSYTQEALFGVGGVALLLLFVGIHNAWDGVSYHVLVNIVNANAERRESPANTNETESQGK